MPKHSQQDKDTFRELVEHATAGQPVEVKPMFGSLGAFVNGNMFAGLFGSSVGVKLTDESDKQRLQELPGAGPFGPAERPMGGWVALPPEFVTDPDAAAEWISKALTQIGALQPKAPKSAGKARKS
jgi:TfoX/Sxy family transcriptional regulator of competence genes